jgi:hypothetical protein
VVAVKERQGLLLKEEEHRVQELEILGEVGHLFMMISTSYTAQSSTQCSRGREKKKKPT